MKTTALLAAAFALAVPGLVQAQDLTEPAPGRQVVDPRGDYVATIVSVDDTRGTAVVDTGSRRGTVALERFGRSARGPMLVTTRAQLDALIDQAAATKASLLASLLVVGAPVFDSAGVALGTVTEVGAEGTALVDGAIGKFYLPRGGFDIVDGQLRALATMAQIQAQMAAR